MAGSYTPVKGSTYLSPTKQGWRRLSRFGQEQLLPAVDQNHSCGFDWWLKHLLYRDHQGCGHYCRYNGRVGENYLLQYMSSYVSHFVTTTQMTML